MTPNFPLYSGFDSDLPIWCITPDTRGCMHRFFDTSPISPSGRYVAVFQMPFENREPQPGEKGTVRLVDLQTGTSRAIAETCGWEPQLGANINWGANDEELFFNDVDTQTWTPYAWKLNPLTGKKSRLKGTVYHVSPDGKLLISADLTLMRATQPGYGVPVPYETCKRVLGPDDSNGFYLTDTHTGERRLLVSVKKLLESVGYDRLGIDNPQAYDFQAFHCKFNPQGTRLMVSVRWFPATGEQPQWNMFRQDYHSIRFAWFTLQPDGSDIHCAIGPEEWEKEGHHATWFPDGKHISMNLTIDRDVMRFVQVRYDGHGLKKMLSDAVGSGHPTVHESGNFLLTDAYRGEPVALADGRVPLRWIDLRTGEEECIAKLTTDVGNVPNSMRCDPHPAWDRSWRYVTFNAMVDGTRRVFIADMKRLLG